MTPERYAKLRETLNKRQVDFTLLTEQIHKPRNIAALVRTADAVGMHEVNIVWPKTERKRFAGTAMGSQRWVDVIQHGSMKQAIESLQTRGLKVFAAHFSDQAVDFRSVDYSVPCAVLMGNEKRGVTDEAAAMCDRHITIPMMGMVESFNVSVAAAIILAEAQRQRQEKGLYDRVNLAPEQYRKTFFRWAHPDIAQYCDKHALDYPAVRESDGEIEQPSAWYKQVRQQRES